MTKRSPYTWRRRSRMREKDKKGVPCHVREWGRRKRRREEDWERYGVMGVGKFAHVSNFDWILDVLYIKY